MRDSSLENCDKYAFTDLGLLTTAHIIGYQTGNGLCNEFVGIKLQSMILLLVHLNAPDDLQP